MERIMIIGCGGSGKSTLARQLGQRLDLPVIHLDQLFWTPGWVNVSKEEFERRHQEAVDREKWILDGNFDGTIPQRLARCDTVLYLDYSRIACILGVIKRILTTYGQVRPDMGAGCPERIDWEFMKWVWNFNRNKRQKNYRLLENAQGVRIVILKNRRQLRKFLKTL